MAASKDEDYEESFDAVYYLKTYYGQVESVDGVTQFMLDLYLDIFKSDEMKGRRLLDIGTGSSLTNVIAQCLNFEQVFLSDYPTGSRVSLHSWCLDNSYHDYSPFFKYVAGKSNNGQTWEDIRDKVQKTLTGILPCDIRLPNPLKPCLFPQFDVISTTFCLHAVPETIEEYRQIIRNVSSLLKPGGWIVESGHLEETYYKVKDTTYNVLYMDKEEVHRVWAEEGFKIQKWQEFTPLTDDRKSYTDWKTIFCMVAQKTDNTI